MGANNTVRDSTNAIDDPVARTGKIRVLDDLIANQIAAGEVVERPASVVKELVENSIDAGASTITVIIDSGGRALVEVLDDGCGMSSDDALLALERFATSKLSSPEDLLSISTLGFRGEALPSIAAVSMLSLESSSDGVNGVHIEVHGGKILNVQEARCARGTRVRVRSLFFNVRARKEFLRSERTEVGFIRALVSDFALAAPHIRFRLVVDGREQMNLPALGRSPQLGVFHSRVKELGFVDSEPVSAEEILSGSDGGYRATVVLSKPLDAVSGSGRLRFLVNGRSVRDRLLLRAVRDGFGNFLHGERYPSGVVRLDLPAKDVDVNVHPQKLEVRFRVPGKVFAVIRRGISRALSEANLVSSSESFLTPMALASDDSRNQLPLPTFKPFSPISNPISILPSSVAVSVENSESTPLSAMRFVGQIFRCYLLLESPEGSLVIVDMHAAHERVTFAKLKQGWSNSQTKHQILLLPEVISLTGKRYEGIEELCTTLRALGFDLDFLNDEALIVRAVPEILAHVNVGSLFRDLLSYEESSDSGHLDRGVDSVLARIACHGSIRSGQELSYSEVYALLEALEDTELGAFCPHGRSVARALTKGEIETLFGRA